MKTNLKNFYDHYLKSLDDGDAAIFVGAGLSQPAGFVNWKELLKDIAQDLDLNVDQEADLIALAQYHINTKRNRSSLNRKLIEEFTKDCNLTENHRLIANLPIHTIWTTNYDTLIEEAFRKAHKRPDVKISKENLGVTLPRRDVTVYKMHGDISLPHEAILTKEDYETYNEKRQVFTTALQGDLLSKTFLFLGFSFTDPNIDYILSRIRSLLGENQREHYCIMKQIQKPSTKKGAIMAQYEYNKKKLELRIADLQRYSIQALLIDDYGEITDILKELNKHSHRKSIFVSGSAHEYGEMGRERIESLAHDIGRSIIRHGYKLISGFGLGIGGDVILGSLEAIYVQENSTIDNQTILRPFPQEVPRDMTREQFYTKFREDMISKAGFTIFISGNKQDPTTNEIINSNGVHEEFRITKTTGKYSIPIGATGYAAREIWQEVVNSIDQFYPKINVSKEFAILGDPKKSNKEIIDAIFAIIKQVVPK